MAKAGNWTNDASKQCRDINALHAQMYLLVAEFFKALNDAGIRFLVVETKRTIERQRLLLKEKKSKTLKSMHLLGLAIDLCPIDNDGRCLWDAPKAVWDKMATIWESLHPKNIAGRFFPKHYKGSTFVDSPHFEHRLD